MVGRIPILDVHPLVDHGRHPAKATIGEPFPVRATVFREGHDRLGAEVVATGPDGVRRPPVRMRELTPGTDRYEAWFAPDTEGAWTFEVQSWSDPLGTWLHDAPIKINAGVDVELMFTEGALLLERVLAGGGTHTGAELAADETATLRAAIEAARSTDRPVEARLAVLEAPELVAVLRRHPLRDLLTTAGPFPAYADRDRALFASWYEFFPRSEGGFAGAMKRLDAIALMGFDVVYLPPIHPIGEVNRKGPNNTLDPGPEDPGSPWAIGSRLGGHDAIHPDLGTIEDFDAFVARARALGMEVALDLALQAAPDHPWVSEHPEWFTTRADGSIAYAENPPKKYQDIYPINFDNDPPGIYAEVLRVVRHWMSHGVRTFRVDNPHTKPLAFWEWLLAEVRRTDPDVVFLSEAFTRPAMLHGLGSIGFHQSYTYFTWRTEKEELEDYLVEVSSESDHVVRPNFFVNTPDILHEFLQYGGPAAFKLRAVLAATSSPLWGVYSGYELFEHVAVRPGSEEYLDSEKYQVRHRDWAAAETEGRSLAPYLTRLNEIRRQHPALRLLRNLTVHETRDDHVLCYSKTNRVGLDTPSLVPREGGSTYGGETAVGRAASASERVETNTAAGLDTVVVVINLDPHGARETTVQIDPVSLGLPEGTETYAVHDELTGQDWTWGRDNYVRLDPGYEVAHILTVRSLA